MKAFGACGAGCVPLFGEAAGKELTEKNCREKAGGKKLAERAAGKEEWK